MSFPALKAAHEKRAILAADLKSILDEAGPERDLTKVKTVPGGKEAVLDVIRQKNTELETLAKEIKDLEIIALAAVNSELQPELVEGEGSPAAAITKSFGRQFVESAAYKERSNRQTAELKVDIRNTLFETTAGWTPESTRTGIISLFPTRPAPQVADFIPTLPTKQAAVKFMRETTFTNAAVEKAEGAAFGEAALALTEISQPVQKIPVFLPVTDEQLEDEEEAAAYIDQRLGLMIRQRLDSQILLGNGTPPNLLGTNSVSGIQTQALGVDSVPDAIYKLFVLIRSDGFAEPSVVFITPAKWQNVRLLKTADGAYVWGPPSQVGPTQIWGVPVAETTVALGTEAYAGDYVNHSSLYVRRGVEVKVSDSHSTFFVEGKQAVRADLRVAMVHYRPKAFGEVTGL